MDTYRTPDEAFANLPDFAWEPSYAEVTNPDGGTLRMAYVDAGPTDGPVALLLTANRHGRFSTGTSSRYSLIAESAASCPT